ASVLQTISETLKFDDDTAAATKSAIETFKRQFRTSEGRLLVVDHKTDERVAKEDIDQEEIVAGGKAH
ncbi:MAG TPA: F0F1 ATP synthase subunit alpha, partial [Propionibacteriaceae bacterium]|nr:F0F1 ATP synthase subunit alpha [Propionibacteriaceae bacterium]